MKVERLTPHIGARVSGLNLADVRISDRDDLRALLEEHLVLFFIGQSLDLDQFQNFGEVIGDLEVTPVVPGLRGANDPVHAIEAPSGTRRGGFTDRWHSDIPYRECPPYATILMPEYLPPLGGDTCWASMYAAYEMLSGPLQRLADELYVVQYVISDRYNGEYTHPLVRVNPKTGQRGLFINSVFSREFAGVSIEESEQLKDMFFTLSTLPDLQVRYRWTPDTVAIWDNRFCVHYACKDYGEPRRLLRLTVEGEPVIGLKPFDEAGIAMVQPFKAGTASA